MSNGYEFNESENSTFAILASSMNVVGIMMLLLGTIMALSIFTGNVDGLLVGIVFLFIGVWNRHASTSIQAIVDTKDQDIEHLMTAMGELQKIYYFQKWLLIIGLIGFVIMLVMIGMPME